MVFEHNQIIASSTWSITHNLNTTSPVVDIWIDVAGTITHIVPLEVQVIDSISCNILFSVNTSGTAVLT
jgi:hypothetical protein